MRWFRRRPQPTVYDSLDAFFEENEFPEPVERREFRLGVGAVVPKKSAMTIHLPAPMPPPPTPTPLASAMPPSLARHAQVPGAEIRITEFLGNYEAEVCWPHNTIVTRGDVDRAIVYIPHLTTIRLRPGQVQASDAQYLMVLAQKFKVIVN